MAVDFSDITKTLEECVWGIRGGWWWRKLTPEEIELFAGEPDFPPDTGALHYGKCDPHYALRKDALTERMEGILDER